MAILIIMLLTIPVQASSLDKIETEDLGLNRIVFSSNEVMGNAGSDAQPTVPESFIVKDGLIFIDNPIAEEITIYKDNKKIDNIAISNYSCVLDMRYINNQLYKLDSLGNVTVSASHEEEHTILSANNSVNEDEFAELSDVNYGVECYPNKIVCINDTVSIKMDDGTIRTIGDSKLGGVINKYDYSRVNNVSQAIDKTCGTIYQVEHIYEAVEMSELEADENYRYFFVCEVEYVDGFGHKFHKYVYKYANDGQLISVYPLEDAKVYVPNKQVAVFDGKVYQMLIKDNAVQILELRQVSKNKFLLVKEEDNEQTNEMTLNSGVDIASVSETTIINTLNKGIRLSNLTWTYSKTKNGDITAVTDPDQRKHVEQPYYLKNVTGSATIKGYPYCWGGFDSETTASNSEWSNFADGLSKNKYAGNVCSATVEYKIGTIGIDCSGLVSATYSLGYKHGSYGLIGSPSKYPNPVLY